MTHTSRKPEKITEDAQSIDEHHAELAAADTNTTDKSRAEPQREPGKIEAEAAQITEEENTESYKQDEKIYTLKKNKKYSTTKYVGYFVVLVSLLIWSVYEAVQWTLSKWNESILAGLSTTVLLVSLVSFLVYIVISDIKAILAIKEINKTLSFSADKHYSDEQVKGYIQRITETIKLDKPDTYNDFIKVSKSRTDTDELISLFKNTVLIDIDKETDRQIEQYARSSSIALAVLPHPALDALVILIQAIRMTKEIGSLYGIHTGFFTSIFLMRETVKNIMLLTSIDFVGEVLVDEFSAGVAGKAGKGIAKGAVIYYRVKRLGHATKKLCRPDF